MTLIGLPLRLISAAPGAARGAGRIESARLGGPGGQSEVNSRLWVGGGCDGGSVSRKIPLSPADLLPTSLLENLPAADERQGSESTYEASCRGILRITSRGEPGTAGSSPPHRRARPSLTAPSLSAQSDHGIARFPPFGPPNRERALCCVSKHWRYEYIVAGRKVAICRIAGGMISGIWR